MRTLPYLSTTELLSGGHSRPALLDSIDFDYQGVRVHAYGTLHALTGGSNRAYVKLVNDTIAQAPGLKLGEKGMRAMYKGLDGELDDWIQVPLKDAFRFPLSLLLTPTRIARLGATILKEYLTREDRFGANGIHRLQDIGGAAAFHLLAPLERRQLVGLPAPRQYLLENLLRRRGKGKISAPHLPDPDWYWLPLIEPYVNIPCRSVHMLEFSVALAKLKGVSEVSLFTGEIHNSDMGWYQENAQTLDGMPDWAIREVQEIRRLAQEHAQLVVNRKFSRRKLAYASAMSAGLAIPVFGYMLAARWLMSVW